MTTAGRTTTIPLPTPFAIGRVNCYLLHGSPLTLIDPGPRSSETREALVAALAEEGLELSVIELILVTHQHTDHAGLAGTIAAESGAAVGAHCDLVGYLRDMTATLASEDDYQARMMLLHDVAPDTVETLRAVSKGFHHFAASVEIDRPLRDGDVIDAGGRRLRALHRPGHSPSDIVLVDEDRGIAFVGDPCWRRSRRTRSHTARWSERPTPATARRRCPTSSPRSPSRRSSDSARPSPATASRSTTCGG